MEISLSVACLMERLERFARHYSNSTAIQPLEQVIHIANSSTESIICCWCSLWRNRRSFHSLYHLLICRSTVLCISLTSLKAILFDVYDVIICHLGFDLIIETGWIWMQYWGRGCGENYISFMNKNVSVFEHCFYMLKLIYGVKQVMKI